MVSYRSLYCSNKVTKSVLFIVSIKNVHIFLFFKVLLERFRRKLLSDVFKVSWIFIYENLKYLDLNI